jgi:hypothetical protein
MTNSTLMPVEVKLLRRVNTVLATVREVFSSNLPIEEFYKQAEAIYQQLHSLIYKTKILHPADGKFVGAEGSEGLLTQTIPTENSIDTGARDKTSTELHLDVVKIRKLYLLLEDLASYFHQPGHFSSLNLIEAYAAHISNDLNTQIDELDACLSLIDKNQPLDGESS